MTRIKQSMSQEIWAVVQRYRPSHHLTERHAARVVWQQHTVPIRVELPLERPTSVPRCDVSHPHRPRGFPQLLSRFSCCRGPRLSLSTGVAQPCKGSSFFR